MGLAAKKKSSRSIYEEYFRLKLKKVWYGWYGT